MSSFTDQFILNRLGCEMQGRHIVMPERLVVYFWFDFEIARKIAHPSGRNPLGGTRTRRYSYPVLTFSPAAASLFFSPLAEPTLTLICRGLHSAFFSSSTRSTPAS